MKFKKMAKQAWRGFTSEKARVGYMKVGTAIKVGGQKTANYFERTNRSLDRIVGTRDPNPGRMTGVALPKGYKIQTVPKIIKGPRGYSVFEEKQLVRINRRASKPRKKKRK